MIRREARRYIYQTLALVITIQFKIIIETGFPKRNYSSSLLPLVLILNQAFDNQA